MGEPLPATAPDRDGSPAPPPPVPDLDWTPQRARDLGEEVLGLWEEFLTRLPQLPVGRRHTAKEVAEAVDWGVPDAPVPLETLTARLRELTFDHAMYPGHPGFLAYISGAGTVPSAPADLLAAALNQNVGGWRLAPGATELEQHLIRWFADRLGLPETAGGYLMSGGAMVNHTALTVARDVRAGWDVRAQGVAAGPQLVLYGSADVHDTVVRAADMLGFGAAAGARRIPTDADRRMDVDALLTAIAEDRAAGRRPLAVVGTAGTTATGAIDPLERLADVAAEHDLWFHVDAAYGGPAAMTDRLRDRFAGIERADSVGLDPHKWLYTSHPGACLLVRHARDLSTAFGIDVTYTFEDKETTGRGIDVYQLSPHFSRPFAALKVWMSLQAHGWDAYQRRIAHDCDLAAYLFRRAEQHPDLEAVGPQELSIACFRYAPSDLAGRPEAETYLDHLNERLMTEIQLDGRTFPSNAVLDGRFVLRACIVNFRTEASDLDALVDATVRLGAALDADLRPVELG